MHTNFSNLIRSVAGLFCNLDLGLYYQSLSHAGLTPPNLSLSGLRWPEHNHHNYTGSNIPTNYYRLPLFAGENSIGSPIISYLYVSVVIAQVELEQMQGRRRSLNESRDLSVVTSLSTICSFYFPQHSCWA